MLKFVTFNIRCIMKDSYDGINDFIHRAGLILDTIDTRQPDVICFQEAIEPIYRFLEKHLNGYSLLWRGRSAELLGEGLLLAVKKGSAELLDTDAFWLSDTPDVPGSRYNEQSVCPRICVVSVLRLTENGKTVRIYNTHLDHEKEYARNEGIKLILERIKTDTQKNPMPTILAGDFNAAPESLTVKLTNTLLTDVTAQFKTTYHAFGKRENCKIDYVYLDVATAKTVQEVFLWEEMLNGIYLSDHYPIECDVDL